MAIRWLEGCYVPFCTPSLIRWPGVGPALARQQQLLPRVEVPVDEATEPTPYFDTEIRVRYDEADPMGYVHHANYLRYLEICRTEALRAYGGNYKEVEAGGLMIVVVRADVRYRQPAHYDDVLTIRLRLGRVSRAKIQHHYEVFRDGVLLSQAELTLAAIDSEGNVQPVPDWAGHLPDQREAD